MPEYQQRVIQETDALKLKLDALNEFIISPKFEDLSGITQDLLRKQHVAMFEYHAILRRRIANFAFE